MLHKHLVLSLLLSNSYFCFCAKAYSQNIEVSLEIDLYSPYIKKYTKEQMEKKLLDSVISYCRLRYLNLGRPINIYTKDNPQPKSNLLNYKLELSVEDTVFNTRRFTNIQGVWVLGNFYEEETPTENIKKEVRGSGASYSQMPSSIVGESKAITPTEANAIDAYFTWATIRAGTTIDWLMPLSLTERIPARNLFEKDELNGLESFAEMVVKIEPEKMDASHKGDIDRLIAMINNIFFSKQNRVARRRSPSRGKSQFNYYLTTDSIGYTGPTIAGNPIELKIVIESIGQCDYQIKLEFDEQKYLFRSFFGVSQKERIIPVSGEMLRNRPSKVNSDITDWVETFVNSNTR